MAYGVAAGAPPSTSHTPCSNNGQGSTRNTKRNSSEQTSPTPPSSTTDRMLSGGVNSDPLRNSQVGRARMPRWTSHRLTGGLPASSSTAITDERELLRQPWKAHLALSPPRGAERLTDIQSLFPEGKSTRTRLSGAEPSQCT